MDRDHSSNDVELIGGDASTELSANRTALSFARTGMSADRTLMAVVRTSLSMIGFGFTIFQFFRALNDKYLDSKLPEAAPRNFGFALILLGVVLLVLGILHRREEAAGLQERRKRLHDSGLIRSVESKLPSSAMVVAILLLIIGLLALLSVGVRMGPF